MFTTCEYRLILMACANPITLYDEAPRPRPRAKVVPLRAPRAWLEVVLTASTADTARAHLATLLHSPLGVYVAQTGFERGVTRVLLDIAPEDIDFTLHTLMTTVPQAAIGALRERMPRKEA
ncbi:hypothetical protein [Paraburkholderia unamae]|uniref:hypothetical protein n=1 Tax=Paraburkholderia unamae TaxID=219649 RepID=UPI0021ACE4C6|nr:hypothetical protein [Paraburkholderia unamae]